MGFLNANFAKVSISEPSALGLRCSVFPRRAPEVSAASRESATCGSDVELEAMESEQTGFAFSLVEFPHEYLYPSPGAHDTVSFGLDILLTAASDSEDFGPALADALPPIGQEARDLPRPTLSSWTCFCAPLKSSLWIGPTSPKHRNSTSSSLAAWIPDLNGESCHFSAICIRRSANPGSSLFPLTLLTRQPLTSPTLWVLWSRVTPAYLWLRTLWPPAFHPLWRLPGSLVPSFQLSHVGPLPPLLESASRPVRPPYDGHPPSLPGGRAQGDGWRDWSDSRGCERAAQSHWLGSESH